MTTGLDLGRPAVVTIIANELRIASTYKEKLKRVWSWRVLTSSTLVFLTHSVPYNVNERRLPMTLSVVAILNYFKDAL